MALKGRNCPKCDSASFYVLSTNVGQRYKCKTCRHQYTDKSNTLFHRCKLPLEKINKFIEHMKSDKRISINKLSKITGVQYKTAHRLYWIINYGILGN